MAETVAERVVFFGRFGAPSLAFARSCAAMGVRVYLLTPGGGGTSRCLADVTALRPGEVLAPQGIAAVAAYVRKVGAQALAAIEDALRSRDELRPRDYSRPLLAQPLKRMPNLLVHAAGGEVAAFLVDRKFEGITLRIHRYPMPAGLAGQVRDFGESVGLSGAHHYEFLFSPLSGECSFLEVNARFGGTTDKVRLLGFDEAALCLAGYGFRTPRPLAMPVGWRAVANKRELVRHIWSMLRRAADPWDYPAEPRWKGILRSLADLAATRDSVWDWRDLPGAGAYHLRLPGAAPGRH
jgi:hypothetical protein